MSSFVVFDTDLASNLFNDNLPDDVLVRLVGYRRCITFVTLGEIMAWASANNWGIKKRHRLEKYVSEFLVVQSTQTTSRIWAEISTQTKKRGRPIPQNDTWIAATCMAYKIPLATQNFKDFRGFAKHNGLQLLYRHEEALTAAD